MHDVRLNMTHIKAMYQGGIKKAVLDESLMIA